MTEHRPFRYAESHGVFYSPLDGGAWKSPYGRWQLAGTVAELPDAPLHDVVLREPGDGGPSDDGRSWQDRAVAAEMQAATHRSEIAELQRKVAASERARDAAQTVAQRPLARAREEIAQQRRWLDELSRMVAKAYGREGERIRDLGPTFSDMEWEPTAEECYEFAAETLGRDHPSVAYPAPSAATVASATAAVRERIGDGSSIEAAVAAALARLAVDRRSEVTKLRRQLDGMPVPWAEHPGGASCPVCGHERGEHAGPGGKYCESAQTASGRICGCMGPMTLPGKQEQP